MWQSFYPKKFTSISSRSPARSYTCYARASDGIGGHGRPTVRKTISNQSDDFLLFWVRVSKSHSLHLCANCSSRGTRPLSAPAFNALTSFGASFLSQSGVPIHQPPAHPDLPTTSSAITSF